MATIESTNIGVFMKLTPDNQKLFDAALENAKMQITLFYDEKNHRTHYILFLEYIQLSKTLAALQNIDLEDDATKGITDHLYSVIPHSEILAKVMSPEYFPDPSVMMDYMMMNENEIRSEKLELMKKRGLYNI